VSGQAQRKYAVQKPKGSKWETLSLVDTLAEGKSQFRIAIDQFGQGYVRLIQVDFLSDEALADFDWRLIELHDPFKGNGPPKPTLVASSARTRVHPPRMQMRGTHMATPGGRNPPIGGGGSGGYGPVPGRRPGDDKASVSYTTLLAVFLFGAAVVVVWALWFGGA